MSFHSDSRATWRHAGRRSGVAFHILRRLVPALAEGSLTIVTPSGKVLEQGAARPGIDATLVLHRWRAIRRLITHGDLGFAEAYIDGDWSSPDLIALIELSARNIEQLDSKVSGLFAVRLLNRLRHLLNANTKSGSRQNIAFHYDLGNAFYRCWLDTGMTYSSALYDEPGQALEQAQTVKLNRIMDLLDLDGKEDILEIGCGWGTLAMSLGQAGHDVTGITLSREQLAWGNERIAETGLTDTVRLKLKDYRDIEGSYDRIVSIEMLEAVGEAYWPAYFQTLHARLKQGGKAVLQVITIDEKRFENYRGTADFIQRYIFPGGMLPSKSIIAKQAADAGLKYLSAEHFGESYALTLAEWRQRFLASWPRIEAMGFSPAFRKLWEYYLGYCEAGFRAGTIDVGLYVFSR